MLRTVNDQLSLWDAILPAELLVLPGELARVDAMLDDPVFFAPFVPYFDPRIGRPAVPMETYLRMMFLKFRYRLGFVSLCREVGDSISWQRFCRIPFGTRVPHPTKLMKLTSRCGEAAVAGLNDALLTKAAAAKLIRTDKVRAGTTVVEAAVAYPTDSGLLVKAVGGIAKTISGFMPLAQRPALGHVIAVDQPVSGRGRSRPNYGCGVRRPARKARRRCCGSPGSWPTSPKRRWRTPMRYCAMHAGVCAPRRVGAAGGCTKRSTT